MKRIIAPAAVRDGIGERSGDLVERDRRAPPAARHHGGQRVGIGLANFVEGDSHLLVSLSQKKIAPSALVKCEREGKLLPGCQSVGKRDSKRRTDKEGGFKMLPKRWVVE